MEKLLDDYRLLEELDIIQVLLSLGLFGHLILFLSGSLKYVDKFLKALGMFHVRVNNKFCGFAHILSFPDGLFDELFEF